MTDRFLDGDPANNRPPGSAAGLYDPEQKNIDLYHGGDFRGLEIALRDGYFNDLGVTAIWITPPVRNVWYSAFDSNDAPKTGYHGYWTQDFLDIDPHLTSARSLDGSHSYPDSREGRLQHYRDLVALAHSRGIKIIQDIVCNHAGPVFYYDVNQNGRFDRERKAEWIRPFRASGPHGNAVWAETEKWNQSRTAPTRSQELLGFDVPLNGALGRLSSYGRRGMSPGSLSASDGEEVLCDFLAMRDFNTAPESPHFDALVDDFVSIYAFYAEAIGVDGFRIDTVKHVHHAFWDAFTERLRDRIGAERSRELILFGEVYDGNPVALGKYTYQSDWPADPRPSIDSLLNFQFCYAVRAYLRTGSNRFGTAHSIENAIHALSADAPPGRDRPYYNPTPGPDGLNASQKVINFVENHDGINRFRVRGVSEQRHFLANALTLTMPGIPCLYYGSETALQDPLADPGEDSETGRLTYLKAGDRDALAEHRKNPHFKALAELIRLRGAHPGLKGFDINPLWIDSADNQADDGIFAFARGKRGGGVVIIVVNASTEPATTAIPGHQMRLVDATGASLLKRGERLESITHPYWNGGFTEEVDLQWSNGQAEAAIRVGPESFNLFQVVNY